MMRAGLTAHERGVRELLWSLVPPSEAARADDEGPQLPAITDDDALDKFLRDYFNVALPHRQCCTSHSTPWDAFHDAYFARQPISVWKASRGMGGKSFTLSALAVAEALTLRADVNILGGSGEQSKRVLESIGKLWEAPSAPRGALVSEPGSQKQRLVWGNRIVALMASQASVRGPHPQRLRLDECLAAGTPVATPQGDRPIEDLKPGDEVWCWHEGAIQRGHVRCAWRRGIRDTIRLRFDNGAELVATPEHPVRGADGQWRQAAEATDACAVSAVLGEADPHRSTEALDHARVHALLPRDVEPAGRQSLRVRWPQGGPLGHLQSLLPDAPAPRGAAVRGLQSAAETGIEAVSTLPSAVDESAGLRPDGGLAGNRVGQNDEPCGASGARASRGAGVLVPVPSADRLVGGGPGGGGADTHHRSARGVLARPAVSGGTGCAKAARPDGDGVHGAVPANQPDAPVVAATCAVRVIDRARGLSQPVFDLATTFGTYIAAGVVVHNCDEMKLGILDSALGQPMSKGWILSQVVLSSTHQYPDGTMTEILKRAAAKNYPVYEWCYRENLEPHGWLSLAEVERKRAILTAAMWETEIELQEPSSEGRAMDTDQVKAAFRTDVVLEPPVDGAVYGTGADWAKKVNHTVIVTIRKDVRPMRVVAVKRTQREPWPAMAGYLDARIAEYGGTSTHDNTGLGQVVHDMLRHDSEPFNMVGRDRADLLSEYIAAIEKGELVWPEDDSNPALAAARSEHIYATREDVYKGSKDGTSTAHLPDTISAGALAWRAAKQSVAASAVRAPSPGQTDHLERLRQMTQRRRRGADVEVPAPAPEPPQPPQALRPRRWRRG